MRNNDKTYQITSPEFWGDSITPLYARTLAEAKKERTRSAKGVGCATWSIHILKLDKTSGNYERII